MRTKWKLILVAVLLLLAGCAPAYEKKAFEDLPNDFQVNEEVISMTNSFDIIAGKNTYGTVTEKMFSWTRTFFVRNSAGVDLGKASARAWSWGTHIDVYDASGKLLGGIKEEVTKSMFKTWTSYSILDPANAVIARSKKVEFFGTDVTISSPAGEVLVTISRPAVNWVSDTWNVSIKKPGVIDPRMVVVIGAYKTAVDNERAAESDDSSSRKK